MSKEIIRSIKGTQDILPEKSKQWQSLEASIQRTMELYNFKQIRTPAFERTDLFTHSVGKETDIVSKEMYSWIDQGNEKLTLKPELTAPVARAFIQHNLGALNPITKLYYIDALFRRERPQKGRFRQFHQFGVETFGSENPEADAEVIFLAVSIFKNLGIKELSLNINSIGSPDCRDQYREALKVYLKPYYNKLSEASKRRFEKNPLRILDTKSPEEIEIIKNSPNISEYWTKSDEEHFNQVCNLLSSLNIDYNINANLVRGLDYYSRTTFEISSEKLGAQNAICGGGRYDNLVEKLGGKPTPGIGFAAGMERVLLLIDDGATKNNLQIYIVTLSDIARPIGIKILQDLRNNNIKSDFDVLRRSVKAQMRDANKSGAKFALLIGDDELKNNQVVLKNLTTGSQDKVEINSLIKHLNSLSL